MLDLLESMRRAIAEYQIRGASGLRDAVQTVVGRLVVAWDSKEATAKDAEAHALVSKFWGIFSKLDKAASVVLKYTPVLDKVPKLHQYLPFLPALPYGGLGG